MRVHVDSEVDAAYLTLTEHEVDRTEQLLQHTNVMVNVDYDADGFVVGLEVVEY